MKFSVATTAIFAAVAAAAPALVPAAGSEGLIDPRASVDLAAGTNNPEARGAILQIGTGKPGNNKNGKNEPIIYLNLLDLIKLNVGKRDAVEDTVPGNALFTRGDASEAGSNNPEARGTALQIGTGKPANNKAKGGKEPIIYLNLLDLVKLNVGKRDVVEDSVPGNALFARNEDSTEGAGSHKAEARDAILQIGTGKPNNKKSNGKNEPIIYLNLLDLVKLNVGKRDVVEGQVPGNTLLSRAEDGN